MMERLLKVKIFFLFLVFTCGLSADLDFTLSNTNYTISQGSIFPNDNTEYIYNYDRLRFRADYKHEKYFATLIADGVNYLGHDYVNSTSFGYVKLLKSDTPFSTQNNFHTYENGTIYAKLYRLYAGYENEHNRIVVGLQNITMGVGRIWNPTNLFNPRNAYALEPDEIFPVAAISYTRYIGDVSHLTLVVSQTREHDYKYAARYKAFLNFADVAVNIISSDETKMFGYEIEGDLADTGIEVRSEGAYIKNDLNIGLIDTEKVEFFQGIVGADYGFENGLSVAIEALYTSKTFSYQEILNNINSEILPNLLSSSAYFGTSLSYNFNLFLAGSLGYIESFADKNSRFITPSLTYTYNDFGSYQPQRSINSTIL